MSTDIELTDGTSSHEATLDGTSTVNPSPVCATAEDEVVCPDPPTGVDDDEYDSMTQDVPTYLEEQVETIQSTMSKLDRTFAVTDSIRTKVIDKILDKIMVMNLDLDSSDAEKTEVQFKAVDSLRALLADKDKAALNHVSIKMRQKDAESANNVGQIVAEALARMSMTGAIVERGTAIVTEDQAQRQIERKFDELGCAAIVDTELREDPYDFTKDGCTVVDE